MVGKSKASVLADRIGEMTDFNRRRWAIGSWAVAWSPMRSASRTQWARHGTWRTIGEINPSCWSLEWVLADDACACSITR